MRNYCRLSILLLAMLSISLNIYAEGERQTHHPESVGLVLSGGGSKGVAHIGIIKALEDNNIPIDYVTGTSMGAIVGGLYAAGYTPEEMLDLLLSKPFSYWSTGQVDPSLVYYFSSEPPTPALVSVPITTKRDSLMQVKSAVPASIINPMPMSFAFMELFSGITAQCGGDFNKLFVPYRCVASDVDARHKVVLSSGSLGDAVRSSMSFPIVFQPTQVDSMLLYDGGIYDNFPIDVMKQDFAPDFIIGVDVSMPKKGPQTSLMDQLENLVIQNDYFYLDPADGIRINIDLNQFGLLDFPKSRQIYEIGYQHGMAMVDSIKSRISSRVPKEEVELRRAVFKSKTPYIRYDKVNVDGATPGQNKYIKYLFTSGKNDTLSLDEARRAFYRAVSSGKLRDLAPQSHYDENTGLFSLGLKASVKDNLSVGVGGYITSSTSSYVYLSGGYSTLSFSSVSSNLGAWIGQSYLGALLNSRLYLHTSIPSAVELQAVAFRQKYYENDYLFFEDKAPSYIVDHEYFARLKWAIALGSLCDLEGGVGFGHLYDSFYQPDTSLGYLSAMDRCRFNLGQVFLKFESSTLSDINYPVQGNYYKAMAMGVIGGYRHRYQGDNPTVKGNPEWIQLELMTRNYLSLHRHFSLGIESDVMLSTRKLLKDYNASIITAPAFQPMPSCYNYFSPAFRANSYIAAGIVPIYRYNDNLSARLQTYCFLPLRRIESNQFGEAVYSKKWLNNPEFIGEVDICYTLPFATVTGYCHYTTNPGTKWHVGLSFGVFLPAPRFLR